MQKKNLLTIEEAAKLLHITLPQLKKLIKEKVIKGTLSGPKKVLYLRKADIRQYLKGHPIKEDLQKTKKAATTKKIKKKSNKKVSKVKNRSLLTKIKRAMRI